MTKKIKKKFLSELRYDLVSKDWVIIAAHRAKRPITYKKKKKAQPCPFCDISTQETPTLIFSQGKESALGLHNEIPENWTTIVIPNKYPVFTPFLKLNKQVKAGLYQTMNAVGFHEIVVTRDHKKSIAHLSIKQVKEVIDVYQKRYLQLMKEKFVNYISIFHNHGFEAGGSIAHPHSQIITTPLIDSDLKKALVNSRKYFRKHKKCIYCLMNKKEIKLKKRIVFENSDFLAVCPFVSKVNFEVIISPKKHLYCFEKITEKQKERLAEAFQITLKKLYKGLDNPAYNFYLHTVPCDGKNYNYYHWHWTILPKTSIWAGFEIGTKMEILTIKPEKAAEYLRKQ